MGELCEEMELQDLVEGIQSSQDPNGDITKIEAFLRKHPNDPRLHFLRGSVLVGAGRHIDAHQAYSRAIEIAPDFAIARFQLGFFELTSGEAQTSLNTLAPLQDLPDRHYLKMFTLGLFSLVRDDFAQAIAHFKQGIEANSENLPLNKDMQLLINECTPLAQSLQNSEAGVSETSLILNQFSKTSGSS